MYICYYVAVVVDDKCLKHDKSCLNGRIEIAKWRFLNSFFVVVGCLYCCDDVRWWLVLYGNAFNVGSASTIDFSYFFGYGVEMFRFD